MAALSHRRGLLAAAPASGPQLEPAKASIFANIKAQKVELSGDEMWLNKTFKIIDDCETDAAPGLSLRQTAVYAYLCLKWSWFSDCDSQQAENGSLDAAGALRRANFLCGECPLSPKSLQALLETVAGRTFASCGLGAAKTGDAQQMYDDSVSKLTCLLQNFQMGDNVDIFALIGAITDALAGGNVQDVKALMSVVLKCQEKQKTAGFVKCWAEVGVVDCASYEANQVAGEYPKQCKVAL